MKKIISIIMLVNLVVASLPSFAVGPMLPKPPAPTCPVGQICDPVPAPAPKP